MSSDDKISCVPPAFFQCFIQRDSSTDIRTKNDSSTLISIYFILIQEKSCRLTFADRQKAIDCGYRKTKCMLFNTILNKASNNLSRIPLTGT